MEEITGILTLVVIIIAAVFILKKVLKIALRIALLAVIAIAAFIYLTGNWPISF